MGLFAFYLFNLVMTFPFACSEPGFTLTAGDQAIMLNK